MDLERLAALKAQLRWLTEDLQETADALEALWIIDQIQQNQTETLIALSEPAEKVREGA